MAKTLAMLLLFLQITSFIVFAEELESLHTPTRLHPPANAPHHHHHHHNPSPTPAHTPLHTPHLAKPPTHHHHQHPPTHAPVQSPTHHHHHHHPPAHAPVRKPLPVHAPTPGRHPHHHHAPSPAPIHKHTPAHAPTPGRHPHHHHAPSPAPIRTPMRQTPHSRSLLAVQGVVYVKSCKHAGVDTILGAKSLQGAVVKLQCNNTKHNVVLKGKTNKNGYFYIEGSNDISSFAAHKCNVVLVSAPNGLKPSNFHGGIVGAVLKPKKSFVSKGHPFILYNVEPLAFEPKCTH